MDLVETLRNSGSLTRFLEGDSFVQLLAKVGVKAALNAFGKVEYVKDKKSQMWSVINHLEDAEAAIPSDIHKTSKNLKEWFIPIRADNRIGQKKYIQCVMALCYLYLDDQPAARNMLMKAKREGWYGDRVDGKTNKLEEMVDNSLILGIAQVVTQVINPLTWIDIFLSNDENQIDNLGIRNLEELLNEWGLLPFESN